MFHIRAVFCFLFIISFSALSFAHGVNQTNQEQSFTERPKTFIEFFISDLNAKVNIRIDEQGGYRYIESDGIPEHTTGRFPNSGNPHSISSQRYQYRVPLKPKKRSSTSSVGHSSFGVAINGVPFDPATAEYWNNDRSSKWNFDAINGGINLGLDSNNAHVQPNGAYHYHGLPIGLIKQYDYRKKPLLIGYAADGFPVYTPYGYVDGNGQSKELKSSYRVKQGMRPEGPRGRYDGTYTADYEYIKGLGGLDQCNGMSGVTSDYPEGTYFYVITEQYPFIPRCWSGAADSSFNKGPGTGGGNRGERQGGGSRDRQGGPQGRRPPTEALNACSGKRSGASCSFRAPHGNMSGSCRDIGSDLACVPNRR